MWMFVMPTISTWMLSMWKFVMPGISTWMYQRGSFSSINVIYQCDQCDVEVCDARYQNVDAINVEACDMPGISTWLFLLYQCDEWFLLNGSLLLMWRVVCPGSFSSINVMSGFSSVVLLYQCEEWFLLAPSPLSMWWVVSPQWFFSINVKSGFSWVVSPEWFLLSGFSSINVISDFSSMVSPLLMSRVVSPDLFLLSCFSWVVYPEWFILYQCDEWFSLLASSFLSLAEGVSLLIRWHPALLIPQPYYHNNVFAQFARNIMVQSCLIWGVAFRQCASHDVTLGKGLSTGCQFSVLRGTYTTRNTMVTMVTIGGDLQPGCLADWLLTGLGQPQINP